MCLPMKRFAGKLTAYILDDANNVVRTTMNGFVQWMIDGGDERRNLAINPLPGGFMVSTVFLGVDHRGWSREPGPPVVFETAILTDSGGVQIVGRYCTYAAALAGHREIVQRALRETEAREGAG